MFSGYIAAGNKISNFHLSSILNAKLRAHNLKAGSITTITILEDLMVEVITNPLLNNKSKNDILYDLEALITPDIHVPSGRLAQGMTVDNNRRRKRAKASRKKDPFTIYNMKQCSRHEVIIQRDEHNGEENIYMRFKTTIALLYLAGVILSLLISSGQVTEIFKVIDLTNTFTQILLSLIGTIMGALITFFLKKHKK